MKKQGHRCTAGFLEIRGGCSVTVVVLLGGVVLTYPGELKNDNGCFGGFHGMTISHMNFFIRSLVDIGSLKRWLLSDQLFGGTSRESALSK